MGIAMASPYAASPYLPAFAPGHPTLHMGHPVTVAQRQFDKERFMHAQTQAQLHDANETIAQLRDELERAREDVARLEGHLNESYSENEQLMSKLAIHQALPRIAAEKKEKAAAEVLSPGGRPRWNN